MFYGCLCWVEYGVLFVSVFGKFCLFVDVYKVKFVFGFFVFVVLVVWFVGGELFGCD